MSLRPFFHRAPDRSLRPRSRRRSWRLCAAFVAFAGTAAPAFIATPASAEPNEVEAGERSLPPLFDPDLHMRTADVRPGMKGYGLSVFSGTKIERFDVEVVAVLPSTEIIDTNVILMRCSGQGLEVSGPVQGMSGSPIYIVDDDGKERLLGAFALGWSGLKTPLVGVQPIENMLAIDATPPAVVAGQAMAAADWQRNIARFARRDFGSGTAADMAPELTATPNTLRPVGVALATGGRHAASVAHRFSNLEGVRLVPLDGLTRGRLPAAEVGPIEPGSPLVLPLLTGDYNLGVVGTCTTVIGDRVYGFGHPFLGEGDSGMPMASGVVHAVIPLNQISFKLGSAGPVLGTMASDTAAGVAGQLDVMPSMIDLSVRLTRPTDDGPAEKRNTFKIARHPIFASLVAQMALMQVLSADGEGAGDDRGTFDWSATIVLEDGRTFELGGISPTVLAFDATFELSALLEALMQNPFERVQISSIDVSATFNDGDDARQWTVEAAVPQRQRYKPGETVNVDVKLRPFRGELMQTNISMTLPGDLAPGQYTLQLVDNQTAAASAIALPGRLTGLDQLAEFIARQADFPADRLYLQLADISPRPAVSAGLDLLNDLPPSQAMLLQTEEAEQFGGVSSALTASTAVPGTVISAGQSFLITVTASPSFDPS